MNFGVTDPGARGPGAPYGRHRLRLPHDGDGHRIADRRARDRVLGSLATAVIPLGAVVLGIGLVAAAVFNAFALTILAMMLVGLGAIAMAATANTTIQLAVPDELRGRVISVYTTVFVGSTPVGGLLMGWIASAFGVPASLAVAGVGSATAGLLALWWLSRIQARRGVPLPRPRRIARRHLRRRTPSGRPAGPSPSARGSG